MKTEELFEKDIGDWAFEIEKKNKELGKLLRKIESLSYGANKSVKKIREYLEVLEEEHAFMKLSKEEIRTAVKRERGIKRHNKSQREESYYSKEGGRPSKVDKLSSSLIHHLSNSELIELRDKLSVKDETTINLVNKCLRKIGEVSKPTEQKIRAKVSEELKIEIEKSLEKYNAIDLIVKYKGGEND